jgi:hypothetical protein
MKPVLGLIIAVYAALAVIFYVVTTVKLGRPFLIPLLMTDFFSFVSTGNSGGGVGV